MGVLKDSDKTELKKIFSAQLTGRCLMVMFSQENECQYCRSTREMLEELAGLSDKIVLEVHDFVADAELAEKYRVDKIPATVLVGERDYGIRFFGVPGGYEFNVLIQDILNVSRRNSGLPEDILTILKKVDKPVHLQVLALPT